MISSGCSQNAGARGQCARAPLSLTNSCRTTGPIGRIERFDALNALHTIAFEGSSPRARKRAAKGTLLADGRGRRRRRDARCLPPRSPQSLPPSSLARGWHAGATIDAALAAMTSLAQRPARVGPFWHCHHRPHPPAPRSQVPSISKARRSRHRRRCATAPATIFATTADAAELRDVWEGR